jgi:t-SNARE complex subunit (syntaxin)
MPNFKPKTNKNIKVDKKTIETLDNKHNEMLNTFHDEQNIEIPKLLEEKKNLLKTLEKENILIEEKLDIQDNLKRINYKIKQIKKKKKDYLLDNAQHIFEYFEEKKKYI